MSCLMVDCAGVLAALPLPRMHEGDAGWLQEQMPQIWAISQAVTAFEFYVRNVL